MATLADYAGATKLADLLGVDLRETKTRKAPASALETRPCRCLDARGENDPRIWASLPDRCERCGRWLASAIGTPEAHSDMEGLADLADAVEDVRAGLLDEATADGALDEEDYIHWLETRLAATERSLARLCGAAA